MLVAPMSAIRDRCLETCTVTELRSERDDFSGWRDRGHGDENATVGLSASPRQEVAIPITRVPLYPLLGDCCVYTSLKVAVPHFKKLMSPENTGDRNFVLGENRQDLPRGMIIRIFHV